MKKGKTYIGLLLLTAGLLAGCSGDSASSIEPEPQDTKTGIKINADVWRVMEGTRATTYDNQAALQTEGSFTCGVYTENTTTAYVSPTAVDWNGAPTSQWLFSDGKHYWPSTGNLDFFAYMPATKPDYVSAVTYAVNGTPAPAPFLTCANMPITLTPADATKEFIWALTTGQNKAGQGASGVTMNFKHPFARIKFKLSTESGTNVKVNSITIPAVYRDGTCTLTGTSSTAVSAWSSLSDNAGDLVITGDPATNNDMFYLVIPNNYGSKTLTVNATWNDWSNVTKNVTASVAFNWEPGYSYTYTLTLSKYALVVSTEKYTEQW